METSHRHLLHAEEGTWLNIDGFHMGIGGDDSPSPSVSAEFQLSAGRYHYQLVQVKIIITGRLCLPVFRVRKSIMYYLKTQTFGCSVYFFFFLLFYHGSLLPFFPIWLHDINHISKK
ncbi:hypothetical protein [Escherichia coli]|uniref:hypothetical protein n=1 Tax=Escherichia coli TaxID=562 RepID=UPI0038903758